jgi:hypothetical protein
MGEVRLVLPPLIEISKKKYYKKKYYKKKISKEKIL